MWNLPDGVGSLAVPFLCCNHAQILVGSCRDLAWPVVAAPPRVRPLNRLRTKRYRTMLARLQSI